MNLSLRRSTSALLASSLLLTIGRGATLPFMTIYLSRQYSLSVDLIGYAMTIALTIGVVFSLGFGILADKFDKKRYMLLAITAFASGFIAIPLVNNVTLVVTLQYSVGRRLNPANIRALMTAGTLCFVIGLVGFIFSGNSLLMWGMSAAVFTVGEIIYAPGEYMLIDHIAPPGMKASYFSAQSLGWLGAAVNPLVSGVVLTNMPPSTLFIILAMVIIAAWVLMLKGIRAKSWGPPVAC